MAFSTTKLFHAYGLGNGADLPALGRRDRRAAGRPARRRTRILAAAQRQRPTLFFSVPDALQRDARPRPGAPTARLDSVRLCVSAAEPLAAASSGALAGALRARHPRRHRLDRDAAHLLLEPPRARSARHDRQPVPGYELRLVDDDGEPCSTARRSAT